MESLYLLYIGLLMFAGLIFGRLAKLVKLPNVTGYLVAGLLLGPSCFKIIPENILTDFNIISNIALGFIAFAVGSEFKILYLKKVGMGPIVIAILEAIMAVIFVFGGLMACGFPTGISLMLGAIAAATAPAATIMVVRQYRAKGPLTDTLLTVVALDDAVALIAFGIASAIAQNISGNNSSAFMAVLKPIIEIIGALGIGAVLGALFALPMHFFKKEGNRLIIVCAFIFLGVGIAELLGLSSLLLIMAMGMTLVNVVKTENNMTKIADYVTPPIFLLFFTVSGAELNLSVLTSIGLVGTLYVLLRVGGKLFGAYLGAVIMKSPATVKKYLGITLIPQAGVAIGLSLIAMQMFPEEGEMIRTVILCATFIYELLGPALAKFALKGAGEIPAN